MRRVQSIALPRRIVSRASRSSCLSSTRRAFISTSQEGSSALQQVYQKRVAEGSIIHDPFQLRAVQHLDRLYNEIIAYGGPKPNKVQANTTSSSWWQRWTGNNDETHATPPAVQQTPKGLYLHGGVGCGKTFVMDMFFDEVPIQHKRRVHFHNFMLDIHKTMHQLRQQGHHSDPIPYIVEELLQDAWLLCFDEFQVTDVADALILRRLFSALLERGFVMVATSNRPPSELYKNGLQRDLFLPFIEMLYERCTVVSLTDSTTDYRAVKGAHHAHNVYTYPLTRESSTRFNNEFLAHTKREPIVETQLTTQGRQTHVPRAAINAGVCQFTFQELCEKPLGAADYLAIADAFSVVFVSDIPIFSLEKLNSMRRFINFVDCMYDRGIRLHCLADAAVGNLYQTDKNAKSHIDEAFAFDRTISRLLEMSSEAYLIAHTEKHSGHGNTMTSGSNSITETVRPQHPPVYLESEGRTSTEIRPTNSTIISSIKGNSSPKKRQKAVV